MGSEQPLRPSFKNRFHPSVAKDIIKQVLESKLADKTYNSEIAPQWSREIADEIKNKLKELDIPRYKYVVNVALGEQRGEGIRVGCRCFWDPECDSYAQESFSNVRVMDVRTLGAARRSLRAALWNVDPRRCRIAFSPLRLRSGSICIEGCLHFRRACLAEGVQHHAALSGRGCPVLSSTVG